jgi:hypothetical protein
MKMDKMIRIKGPSGLVAFVPRQDASWLLASKAGEPSGKVVTVIGKNGAKAYVNVQDVAFLLGRDGDEQRFTYSQDAIWLECGNQRIRVAGTKVPAPKSMGSFLRIAAQMAHVPEGDMARMFPAEQAPETPPAE